MVLQIHPQSSFEIKTSWRIQLGKLSLLARPTQDQILKWIFLAGERQSVYKHHNYKEHLFELGEHLFARISLRVANELLKRIFALSSLGGYFSHDYSSRLWELTSRVLMVQTELQSQKENSSTLQPFAWYHHLKHIACLCTFGYTYANVCRSNLHSNNFFRNNCCATQCQSEIQKIHSDGFALIGTHRDSLNSNF